jgi:hypothetical protein
VVERDGAPQPATGDDARLYSDETGRRVVVLYAQGSETGPRLDGLQWALGSTGADPADVAEVAGGWWVSWNPDDGSQEPPSAIVFAEGVDESRARAIAEAVQLDVDAGTMGVTDPERLGLVEIAHARGFSITALADPRPPYGSTGVLWGPAGGDLFDQPSLTISTWKQDPAVSAILRAMVDGDIGEVRGAPGAGGSLIRPGDGERLVRTWEEQGMTVLVVASGLDAADVDDVVTGLRPATDADWRRLVEQATVPPPSDQPGIQGRFASGYWSFEVEGTDPAELMLSVSVDLTDGGSNGHSWGPVDIPEAPLLVDVTRVEEGTLVVGVVDAETARIVVSRPDGTTFEPELTRLEGAGGVQVFGQWTDGPTDVGQASSFDSSGEERAHGESGPVVVGPGSNGFSGSLVG